LLKRENKQSRYVLVKKKKKKKKTTMSLSTP